MLYTLLNLVAAKTVHQKLEITLGQAPVDCSLNSVYLINGNFTGPTINLDLGDELELEISNKANTNVSIHLHGFKQKKTQLSDGASFITNFPIPFNSTQTFKSFAEDAGTFLYHAHFELLDYHIYGPLIVSDNHDYEDKIILLSDFYKASPETLVHGLMADPFKFVGLPQNFLINGKANCSMDTVSVEKGKTYRFRIISAHTLFYTEFRIPNHKMTIIEVEGQMIEPVVVDSLEIFSGQRYSVLVTMDQPIDVYYMQHLGRWRLGGPGGIAKLQYQGAVDKPPTPLLPSNNETIGWITGTFKPKVPKTIPKPDETIILSGKQVRVGTGGLKWAINNQSYQFPLDKTLLQHALDDTLDSLPAASKPLSFPLGRVVDFVFQNQVGLNGVCEAHPWHLHGHTFWVMSQGPGAYDPNTPDFDSPIERDTVTLYPFSNAYNQPKGTPEVPCGWVKIRFVADNPGAWLFHCHIASHLAMGMAGSIVVGVPELQQQFKASQEKFAPQIEDDGPLNLLMRQGDFFPRIE